jgi:succinate dehydrogenase / fumarate reductase iron-sulfur subunit
VRLELAVYRSGKGAFDAFELDAYPNMSVLDALFEIVAGPDPTLSFRCSCRLGMCGSCAMVINGRERLACRTKVAALGRRVRLEPLRNLPVVKDLVVDMAPFFDRYQRVRPYFVGDANRREPAVVPPDRGDRPLVSRALDCIGCGACYSACGMVAAYPGYLGPAALVRAFALERDQRDRDPDRIASVDGEDGVWRCHVHGDCMQVCPKGVPVTDLIQRLKRSAARAALAGGRPWRS